MDSLDPTYLFFKACVVVAAIALTLACNVGG